MKILLTIVLLSTFISQSIAQDFKLNVLANLDNKSGGKSRLFEVKEGKALGLYTYSNGPQPFTVFAHNIESGNTEIAAVDKGRAKTSNSSIYRTIVNLGNKYYHIHFEKTNNSYNYGLTSLDKENFSMKNFHPILKVSSPRNIGFEPASMKKSDELGLLMFFASYSKQSGLSFNLVDTDLNSKLLVAEGSSNNWKAKPSNTFSSGVTDFDYQFTKLKNGNAVVLVSLKDPKANYVQAKLFISDPEDSESFIVKNLRIDADNLLSLSLAQDESSDTIVLTQILKKEESGLISVISTQFDEQLNLLKTKKKALNIFDELKEVCGKTNFDKNLKYFDYGTFKTENGYVVVGGVGKKGLNLTSVDSYVFILLNNDGSFKSYKFFKKEDTFGGINYITKYKNKLYFLESSFSNGSWFYSFNFDEEKVNSTKLMVNKDEIKFDPSYNIIRRGNKIYFKTTAIGSTLSYGNRLVMIEFL